MHSSNEPRGPVSWNKWLAATEPADIDDWYDLWLEKNYPELVQPEPIQDEVEEIDWLGPVGFVPPSIPMGSNGEWTTEGRQIYDAAYNKWLEEK